VALFVLQREHLCRVNRHKSTILFFVRVNQVLVRLWARVISLAVRCGVVGTLATDHRSLITDSAVRLMSDRESASGVAMPLLGFCGGAYAPKSDSEGSEARV
jgi:hypothetical protein